MARKDGLILKIFLLSWPPPAHWLLLAMVAPDVTMPLQLAEHGDLIFMLAPAGRKPSMPSVDTPDDIVAIFR